MRPRTGAGLIRSLPASSTMSGGSTLFPDIVTQVDTVVGKATGPI
jgi:hypothetical protein